MHFGGGSVVDVPSLIHIEYISHLWAVQTASHTAWSCKWTLDRLCCCKDQNTAVIMAALPCAWEGKRLSFQRIGALRMLPRVITSSWRWNVMRDQVKRKSRRVRMTVLYGLQSNSPPNVFNPKCIKYVGLGASATEPPLVQYSSGSGHPKLNRPRNVFNI